MKSQRQYSLINKKEMQNTIKSEVSHTVQIVKFEVNSIKNNTLYTVIINLAKTKIWTNSVLLWLIFISEDVATAHG